MLWIALHLPSLSLESFAAAAACGEDVPLALLEAHRIAGANAAARRLGVKGGMKRATALALAPGLQLGQADARRDAEALGVVAQAALAYTPCVSLVPPQGVLLEVGASLRCFGGLRAVLDDLQSRLRPLGHRYAIATAPTAEAAALLARAALLPEREFPRPRGCSEPPEPLAGRAVRPVMRQPSPSGASTHGAPPDERRHGSAAEPPSASRAGAPRSPRVPQLHAADMTAVHTLLEQAPVWLLGPGREHWDTLQGMGLHTVADLARLPRAGVARRFGSALLDELDRALGRCPDPRRWIEAPPRFAGRLELHARADTVEQVLRGALVLLARLVTWLGARHARLRRCELVLRHEPGRRARADGREIPAETRLELALAEPTHEAAHLQSLLRERLARLQLVAPTLELALRCDDIVPGTPPNAELFPSAGSEREGLVRLIERLQARLGRERIRQPLLVEDHRPELAAATRPGAPAAHGARRKSEPAVPVPAAAGAPAAPRPVWLLPAPLPLAERLHQPVHEGTLLKLLSGPERIETGWWDGPPVERDYYIAEAPDGALLWVYRARLPLAEEAAAATGWYLQGRFG